MKTVALPIEEWYRLSKEGRHIPVEITLGGVSMQPLIRKDRDVVTILPLQEEPKVGDIVLFRREDGAYVVHRVYRAEGEQIVTLGDNCENPDPPLKREQVLGKVVKIRRGKRIIDPDSLSQQRKGKRRMKYLPVRRKIMHYKWVLKKNLRLQRS